MSESAVLSPRCKWWQGWDDRVPSPTCFLPKFWDETSQRVKKCNVCEMLYANKLHLFIVFGEHDGHIGNINHLW